MVWRQSLTGWVSLEKKVIVNSWEEIGEVVIFHYVGFGADLERYRCIMENNGGCTNACVWLGFV